MAPLVGDADAKLPDGEPPVAVASTALDLEAEAVPVVVDETVVVVTSEVMVVPEMGEAGAPEVETPTTELAVTLL